jgi:phosphoribosylformylglycinamidine synthase
MTFKAEIDIMPHKELLDPQGKAAARNLRDVHISGVDTIRIGKHVHMVLQAETEAEAREKVETACTKLLANAIMESFSYEISPME